MIYVVRIEFDDPALRDDFGIWLRDHHIKDVLAAGAQGAKLYVHAAELAIEVVCRLLHMATNLAIDDRLLDEALRVGGHRTKKATVTEALREYIEYRRQLKIVDIFGAIEWDPDYDYKKQRRRK